MATYKVPQDVEAEDKILGPFTLRQFIYLIVVALGGWLTTVIIRNTITLIFLPLTLTPTLFFGFLVFLGVKNQSQPAEQYLAAIVRFFFKPHKRIWNQEGIIETVHITAPKKEVHQYTDTLSRGEVKSRLGSLADLMDSRGWAAKDVRYQPNIVLPDQPGDDDRLLSISSLPQIGEPTDVHASDDIMDETASPTAQSIDQKLASRQAELRQQAVSHMNDPKYNPYGNIHQKVIQPLGEQGTNPPETKAQSYPQQTAPPPVEVAPEPAPPPPPQPSEQVLRLVEEGGDNWSVSTLAKEAERVKTLESGDEISLH